MSFKHETWNILYKECENTKMLDQKKRYGVVKHGLLTSVLCLLFSKCTTQDLDAIINICPRNFPSFRKDKSCRLQSGPYNSCRAEMSVVHTLHVGQAIILKFYQYVNKIDANLFKSLTKSYI